MMRLRSQGILISEYYKNISEKLNVPKTIAKKVLVGLEKEGSIDITWHSRPEAKIFLKNHKK